MFTTDFSKAPLQGRAGAIVLAEGRSSAGKRDGVTWRKRLRDGSIPFELLTVDTVEHAEAIARSHADRSVVLIAEERGYSNGVWRAEMQSPMAHNEHFHPTTDEQRAGRTPPRIADRSRRPKGVPKPAAPRRWTVFDTGSMFLGATRYRHPVAWLVTNRYWWQMVGKMVRMSGSVWHGIYWQWPFTLGTLATYRTRDDMLRFARMPEHRHLMQWIVEDTRNATAGFIRLYATRDELERQRAEESLPERTLPERDPLPEPVEGPNHAQTLPERDPLPEPVEGSHFSDPLPEPVEGSLFSRTLPEPVEGPGGAQGPSLRQAQGSEVGAQQSAVGAQRSAVGAQGSEVGAQGSAVGAQGSAVGAHTSPLTLEPVTTEASFQEFLAVPRRGDPQKLAVPLLEDTLRSWREGTAPSGEPVELFLARRGAETVGRTTIHRDARLDAKLGTTATLFGATWATTPDDLRDLLAAVEWRAREDGSAEVFGPASLLPNQVGGVITSGFDQRGFMDSPWNANWVPEAYESAGFARWNESDSWIARLFPELVEGGVGGALRRAQGPAAGVAFPELVEGAGIRIRRASRIRFARDVRNLRALTNTAFAELPYYTEISPAEMRAATDGLIALMDPNLWLFAIDRESGEPVAFVLAVPDITQLLQASGGRVGAREVVAILRGRVGLGMRVGATPGTRGDAGAREAILLIHGALPEVQGRGIVSLLWRQLAANLLAGGYTTLRSTVIGRENPASARHIQRLGGVPLHGHTFYRKQVGEAVDSASSAENATPTDISEGTDA